MKLSLVLPTFLLGFSMTVVSGAPLQYNGSGTSFKLSSITPPLNASDAGSAGIAVMSAWNVSQDGEMSLMARSNALGKDKDGIDILLYDIKRLPDASGASFKHPVIVIGKSAAGNGCVDVLQMTKKPPVTPHGTWDPADVKYPTDYGIDLRDRTTTQAIPKIHDLRRIYMVPESVDPILLEAFVGGDIVKGDVKESSIKAAIAAINPKKINTGCRRAPGSSSAASSSSANTLPNTGIVTAPAVKAPTRKINGVKGLVSGKTFGKKSKGSKKPGK